MSIHGRFPPSPPVSSSPNSQSPSPSDLKQRVIACLNKLADRDTLALATAELDSIAAVVIGGVSFLGGRGNVGNALVGAVMIGVIRNGMNLLNVDAFLQLIVIGVVIVTAVELDVIRSALESRLRVMRAERA